MTFEEFLTYCSFDTEYEYGLTGKLLIKVLFKNPYGKSWTHVAPVDTDALLILNKNELKRYIAKMLFYKLKTRKEI